MSIPESVQKCIAILGAAKGDTEKFAALFMVTKLVKGKDCNAAARRALFEAIGFKFLKKLLTSKEGPEGCPASVYKSVALAILTCFCGDPELAVHKDMLDNIQVFLDIVQTADDDDYDDNLIIVSEAYSCLQNIANYEAGQDALLKIGAISKMSQIYAQQSFQTDEALNLLVTLTNRFGPKSWEVGNAKPFHALISKIALDFETDHTERKFELCGILASLIYSCRHDQIIDTVSGETWPESIYKGLNDVLKSRLGKNQRDPALKLAANTLELLGIEWALSDVENPKTFFLLLLQLCAIEVRMQMDNKSFKQASANGELITSCFIVLELSINYMGTDQLDLEQKEKQQVYTGLKGAFTAAISVLTKLSNDTLKDNLAGKDKAFACAIVRVLSAWLAQETQAMRPQIYQLLPFILKIANDTFYEHRQFRLDNKGNDAAGEPPADVLRVMLPALCHLTVEDKARQILLQVKQDDVLYECVAFHWTIAHYKKPPVPRAERLKRMNEPDPELTKKQLDEMKDSRAAIVSICNVLMNITVLEPKMVESSPLFATLLKFIFDNLPELKDIPENLVLHGHLAVLGLLLLKNQSTNVKKNDFSICRYIQATIRFLWDAYIVDESNDPEALVVAMSYKEHWNEIMELWFLGMQTMSGILKAIPWISEFAIESGWAQGIIETIKKVKIGTLPPNVKSAFEDFLCQLVESDKDVIPVLKKSDALRACRNHRMMDLGKKLFGD